jgi:L-asparagine oxygenase
MSIANVRSELTGGCQSSVVRLQVSQSESAPLKRRLESELRSKRFILERDAGELMEIGAQCLAECLSDDITRELRALSNRLPMAVLIEGLATIDALPETPIRGFCEDSRVSLADAQLLGIYEIFNLFPIAYEYENDGRLARNVAPNPDSSGQRSSHGFNVPLAWHIDDALGPFEVRNGSMVPSHLSPIPHFLGFYCLRNRDRNGHAVPTELLPVSIPLSRLSPTALAALQEPEFVLNPPVSNHCQPLIGVPLVEISQGEQRLRYSETPNQVAPMTERAAGALQELNAAIDSSEAHALTIAMKPGTILLFNNYLTAHRRSVFDPGDDWKHARWLRRIFACESLESGHFVDRVHCPYLWE